MSLGIAFKGPEGIVLAADSRVTLTSQMPGQNLVLHSFFDNATKLLKVNSQNYVGVITYGLGAIGQQSPRTAHSYLPEFENELNEGKEGRLPVHDFSQKLSEFFLRQWQTSMPANYDGLDMVFVIAGYNEGEPYGQVFQVVIPSHPSPRELNAGEFGASWGGQSDHVNRLLQGFDARALALAKAQFNLTDEQIEQFGYVLRQNLRVTIPFQFLPLQDCVDLSIFLIRTTIALQTWTIGLRGVGGAIDVATITRTEGFRPIQQKQVAGEHRSRST